MTIILPLLLLAQPCALAAVDRTTTPSSVCLACHDGSAGKAIGFDVHGAHPLGRRYADAWLRGGFNPLLPGDAVKLVNGEVACTSCHDGASSLRARVAARALCTGCHRK